MFCVKLWHTWFMETPTEIQPVDDGRAAIDGGFGSVAFMRLGRGRVAVKTSADVDILRREAHILSMLSHPYIPTFVAYENDRLVMRDVGQHALTDVLPTARYSRAQYDHMAWCVASALRYLHQHRICHCDVKCDNVVVGRLGDAFLVDFNLTQIVGDAGTMTHQCGTMRYAAPEMFTSAAWNGLAADVWSFGVLYAAILYRVLVFESGDLRECARLQRFARAGAMPAAAALRAAWDGAPCFLRGDVSEAHGEVLDEVRRVEVSARSHMGRVEELLHRVREAQ